MAERPGEIAGSAQLILVPGTVLLHPEEGVFDAMLSGWTAQMRRHLNWLHSAVGDRLADRIVITTGEFVYRRKDGVAVIPLALLGP